MQGHRYLYRYLWPNLELDSVAIEIPGGSEEGSTPCFGSRLMPYHISHRASPHNASHGVLSNLDVIGTSCNALSLVARREALSLSQTNCGPSVAARARRAPPTAILLDTDSARALSY